MRPRHLPPDLAELFKSSNALARVSERLRDEAKVESDRLQKILEENKKCLHYASNIARRTRPEKETG